MKVRLKSRFFYKKDEDTEGVSCLYMLSEITAVYRENLTIDVGYIFFYISSILLDSK